uniref:rhodanese-like domain-containing protein n=1 Tax=Nonomuraea bangladeshensis TaxID=404385 RepID=UPI003F491458
MERVTHENLLSLLNSGGAQLVEALRANAFAAEHLPRTRNMPDQMPDALTGQMLPDRVPVGVCCSGPYCNRSKMAATAFSRLGYANMRVDTDGRQDWAQAWLFFEDTRRSSGQGGRHETGHPAAVAGQAVSA